MRTIESVYTAFSELLLGGQATSDFDALCSSLHVSAASLNEILEEELGMKGPEILQSFQKLLNL